MEIRISQAVFQEKQQTLSMSPFSLRESQFKWDDPITLDLTGFSKNDLEMLHSILSTAEARGAKTAARDVQAWLKALDGCENGGFPKARRVQHGASLLKAYLGQFPRHHVYTTSQEGAETSALAYFVCDIAYYPSRENDGSPEQVRIGLGYELFGCRNVTQKILYYDNILGKTAPQMLASVGLYAETAELRAEYELHVSRHAELSDQIGLQLEGIGYADDEGVDNDNSGHWRYSRDRFYLGKDGVPARLVVDVFRESDREKVRRHSDIRTGFWNLKIDVVDGVAELREDADDAEYIPEIPIHPYLVCFDLTRHTRLRVHVGNVTEYKYNTELRKSLSLPKEHSALIDTLLANRESSFRDLIKNKSGGTIVLLQGKPGTGKTLTAEIYAESLCRPLYSVQCSQLGIELDSLENELIKVLSRGRRWDAVTLIDEADVYVAERGTNLVQNAIVGVFLRVLEYHSGVLFLTTNRSDLVDDAVLSRCTARLEYRKPSRESQFSIWKNLAAANEVLISDGVISQIVNDHDLSGRDIKNILKLSIAISLDRGCSIDTDLVGFVKQFKPTGE